MQESRTKSREVTELTEDTGGLPIHVSPSSHFLHDTTFRSLLLSLLTRSGGGEAGSLKASLSDFRQGPEMGVKVP